LEVGYFGGEAGGRWFWKKDVLAARFKSIEPQLRLINKGWL
jgi:hypothetical protein